MRLSTGSTVGVSSDLIPVVILALNNMDSGLRDSFCQVGTLIDDSSTDMTSTLLRL